MVEKSNSGDAQSIDWDAERDAMRAPAYFAKATSYDIQRGEDAEARAARKVLNRATSAGKASHGDKHCPSCGQPQADTSTCAGCREKHRSYMEQWRAKRREGVRP